MFSKKSLNFKLRASFGILLVLLAAVGATGMHFLDQTSDQFRHVADINLEKTIMLEHLDSSSREIFRRILQYEVNGNTKEDFVQIDQNIEEHLKEYETYRLKYEAIPFVEGEKQLYSDLEETWKKLQPFIKELPPIAKSTKEEDHIKFGEIYRVELKNSRTHFFNALEKLKNFQIEESEKWITKAEQSATHSDRFTIITVTCGLIFGALIAYFISRALTNQILEVTRSLHAGAQVVAEASNEIAQISEELSSSVNQQASAIQETSASTEELSAMVKKNQENASLSTSVSKQSSTTASAGQVTVQDMIQAIKDIEHSNKTMITTVEDNNVNIQEIIHVIHEISSKTNVINEIVFQTKLLSFNASVEAARAGEQGKGFAVVAEEIGSLAQMSGTAAKEISDLLQSSTSKVENIVHQTKSQVGSLMEASKVKVEHGITIAHKCNDVLDQIVGHIGHVDGMVGDISVASLEQSKGIIEISSAMSQLDQTTQINADSSRLMASSSEELSNQAQKLNLLVQDLKYTIEGKSA